MLNRLITPLRAHFEQLPVPRSAMIPQQTIGDQKGVEEEETESAENFAKDVIIELMRNSVESLKEAGELDSRIEVMSEMHRIMIQDACTKDVFRELDGYLLVVSGLSILHTELEGESTPSEQLLQQVEEALRLAFTLLAESLRGHEENRKVFETAVGYESLGQAIQHLIRDKRTVDQTFGFILALSLDNFALASTFSTIRLNGIDDLTEMQPLFGTIRHEQAFGLLVYLVQMVPTGDQLLSRVVWAIAEHLSSRNHRNACLLNDLNLAELLIKHLFSPKSPLIASEVERSVPQKLLKRLLNLGINTSDARFLFERAVDDNGDVPQLNVDVLDVLKNSMKSRWPLHFSMQGCAYLEVQDGNVKGLPHAGFSFMIWLWIEKLPTTESLTIWEVKMPTRGLLKLVLRPDGRLELTSAGNRAKESGIFDKFKLHKSRWTHIALLHHPHRASNPTIRIFLDGILTDSRNWAYPKPESLPQTMSYIIGDTSSQHEIGWCFASANLLSSPLADDVLCLIHHLGPRYAAKYQASDIARYLTYDASTSLTVFFSSAVKKGTVNLDTPLLRAIKNGICPPEDSFVFSLSPNGYADEMHEGIEERCVVNSAQSTSSRMHAKLRGDVFVALPQCLDDALWKIGGAAVALRLIELASNPHDLSRTISILVDGLRGSWQNSDDMERLHGYEIIAAALRKNRQLINMTSFELLFEFLGVNFRTPDQSAIINTAAYRVIALDFEIWSGSRTEIQRVHLEHFTTLLKTSKYKQFNMKQRIAKYGVVRKLLFVLQTDWYPEELVFELIDAFKVVAQVHFSTDETIKPVTSYLAANLHEAASTDVVTSPGSTNAVSTWPHSKIRAEQVFMAFVSILSSPACFSKFSGALPLTRLCLLLLGEHPSSLVACQVLTIINMALRVSSSFNRKFELVSGWTVLKEILPKAWDLSVHKVSFDILLGRTGNDRDRIPNVACHYIVPAIFATLHYGLQFVTLMAMGTLIDETEVFHNPHVEFLLEELMNLQSSSPTFRQLFKSQALTTLVVDAYKFVAENTTANCLLDRNFVRLLEKLNHFVVTLTLDKNIASTQKKKLLDLSARVEQLLNIASTFTPNDMPALVELSPVLPRLGVQFVRDQVYKKTMARISDWRKAVVASERKRFRKTFLDLREQHRQAATSDEWRRVLFNDRGLWKLEASIRVWALDETEGPCRVRKKLEPQFGLIPGIKIAQESSRIGNDPGTDADVQSILHVEAPPWAENYEFTVTESNSDGQWVEDIEDDKHRRIRHQLEPGDVIEAVSSATRIVGVDSSPGLLILGKNYLYMLDGLVENEDGEVVDVRDAPKNILSVPGTLLELDAKQRAQRWPYEQLTTFSKRTCLFRDVALEVYFKDSRSLLIVFASSKQRQDVSDRLTLSVNARQHPEPRTPMMLRTPLLDLVGAKVFAGFRDEISTAQRKWQAREISNFTYLSILNQSSGRTPADATQYPVFPWILADYSSDALDLASPSTFRDLTRPMGALTEDRREAAESRYTNLASVDEVPFHYGTHFSSSMIVCHFLIRLEPFTHMFKTLQGGDWDLPDRLFTDVSRSYHSASTDLRGDVRELIPEFFTCPEFLENTANLDFGVQQRTGERINNVRLPTWAKEDPLLFIIEHRRALESDFVSDNLPAWIDLIWGCNQRDPESLNVFHPFSYEGAINLDSITDELEREATVGIIHNFGQTPRKIFQNPHPPRLMSGPSTLPLGSIYGIEEDAHLLIQSSRSVKDINVPVAELTLDLVSERILPCQKDSLYVAQFSHEQIMWGFVDRSLRLFVDRKVHQVAESTYCTCAAFADSDSLVTGSADCTVRLWQLNRKDGSTTMRETHIMRAHTEPVVCITACRAWSMIVSGSEDGTAVIWDLNRAAYVRTISHHFTDYEEDCKVHLVSINESTGYIATCSQQWLCLHSINAHLIVQFDLSVMSPLEGIVTSLAFHEREYSRLGVLATGTSTGVISLRTWNTSGTPAGERAQWKFVTLRTLRCREKANGKNPTVTALKFVGECLYHGEDCGEVYSWDLPE